MRRFTGSTGIVIAAGLLWSGTLSAQVSSTPRFFQIDPRSSFYRAGGEVSLPPTILFLGHLGAGARVELVPQGLMQAAGTGSPVLTMSDNYFTALFSTSPIILDETHPHRIPGALPLPAGVTSLVTVATFYGGFQTDVAEDVGLAAAGVVLDVPAGAQYLMLSWYDNYYSDNVSPDPARFGVSITAVHVTPEPGTIVLVATGLLAVGFVQRRRLRSL